MTQILVAVAAFVTATGSSVADDPKPAIIANVDYLSKYMWRGQNLSDDPVFQPSVTVTYGALSASLWGNMDTTNINSNGGRFSEIDTTVGLTGQIPGTEGIICSLGVTHYHFPGTAYPDTTECYGGFSLALPLSPTLTAYRDVGEAEGTYYALSLNHSISRIAEIAPDVPVGITAGLNLGYANSSYNRYYWGITGDSFQDLALTLALPVTTGNWTMTPRVSYVTILSNTIRDADTYGTSSDNFSAGISISTIF
jgi:uncharacterized protein (TIGR02001 family)